MRLTRGRRTLGVALGWFGFWFLFVLAFMTLIYHYDVEEIQPVLLLFCVGLAFCVVLALLLPLPSVQPPESPRVRVRLSWGQIWRLSLALGVGVGLVVFPYLILQEQADPWTSALIAGVLTLLVFLVANVALVLGNRKRDQPAPL